VRAALAGDPSGVERAFSDMMDMFGGTTFAQPAGLLTAAMMQDKGNNDAAKAALSWVADKASDEGYQAVARLRLAGVLVEAKAYDDALKQLAADFPRDFAPLAADRRGDIYNLQGKKAEARAEYEKAYKGLDDRVEYRRLVEVKLSSLGVDPKQLGAPVAPAAAGSAKP